MKYLMLIMLLPVLALGQEDPADDEAVESSLEGEPIAVTEVSKSDLRATTPEVLNALYRSEVVRDQCLKTPDDPIDVTLNGYKVPFQCSLWTRWYAAEQERIRREAESAAEAP